MLPCYLQLHIIGTIFKSRVGDIREAHVILRSWCVPYQLVANNRSFSSCPFGLDLTGRTWLVSFPWSRVQNLHGTLGRCLFGAFPEVAKPIFASPPVSPPAREQTHKIRHCIWPFSAGKMVRICCQTTLSIASVSLVLQENFQSKKGAKIHGHRLDIP